MRHPQCNSRRRAGNPRHSVPYGFPALVASLRANPKSSSAPLGRGGPRILQGVCVATLPENTPWPAARLLV